MTTMIGILPLYDLTGTNEYGCALTDTIPVLPLLGSIRTIGEALADAARRVPDDHLRQQPVGIAATNGRVNLFCLVDTRSTHPQIDAPLFFYVSFVIVSGGWLMVHALRAGQHRPCLGRAESI